MATKQKKPGMLKRLFSSKKLDVSGISEEDKKKFQRSKSMDASMMRPPSVSEEKPQAEVKKRDRKDSHGESSGKHGKNKSSAAGPSKAATDKAREAARDKQNGQKPRTTKPRESAGLTRDKEGSGSLKRRKGKKEKKQITVSIGDKIEFPCTPEVIQEHHRVKPFLNPTEEWLVVELGEFECLIDSMDIIKVMAKHSKFFEVEPDELVEEFFEFVDDVPSYDEVVNYDVWQEFRDKKYLC